MLLQGTIVKAIILTSFLLVKDMKICGQKMKKEISD